MPVLLADEDLESFGENFYLSDRHGGIATKPQMAYQHPLVDMDGKESLQPDFKGVAGGQPKHAHARSSRP